MYSLLLTIHKYRFYNHMSSFYKQTQNVCKSSGQSKCLYYVARNFHKLNGTAACQTYNYTWCLHSTATREITRPHTESILWKTNNRNSCHTRNHPFYYQEPVDLQITGQNQSRCHRTFTQSQMATTQGVTMDNIFSDWNRHRFQSQLESVKPVRTMEMMNYSTKKPLRVAAVLVPLCVVDGQPSVLLTLRSSSLRKHRGEICFPGGNQEETDPNVAYTALRETFEEIGLNPRHFDVWGSLTPTPSSAKTVVYPVVAYYTQPLDVKKLVLNTEEVEEVFTCAIQDLCDGGKIKVRSTQFRTKPGYTLPVYIGGQHRIWGLTAIILHQVLHLIAPGLYTYRIHQVA